MKPRTKRLAWIVVGLAILAVAVTLVLRAFQNNLTFFFTPSDIARNEVPHDRPFRIGGLVEAGSVKRGNGLDVSFRVTDMSRTVIVAYRGILPDLFKEGKGVVVTGSLGSDGVFHASDVLAKHDENYMPPEAAEALRRAGKPIEGKLFAGEKAVVTQPVGGASSDAAPSANPSGSGTQPRP